MERLTLSNYSLARCACCRRIMRTRHLGFSSRCKDRTECILSAQIAWRNERTQNETHQNNPPAEPDR